MYIIVYRHNKKPAYLSGKKPVEFEFLDAATRKARMMNVYHERPGFYVPMRLSDGRIYRDR